MCRCGTTANNYLTESRPSSIRQAEQSDGISHGFFFFSFIYDCYAFILSYPIVAYDLLCYFSVHYISELTDEGSDCWPRRISAYLSYVQVVLAWSLSFTIIKNKNNWEIKRISFVIKAKIKQLGSVRISADFAKDQAGIIR